MQGTPTSGSSSESREVAGKAEATVRYVKSSFCDSSTCLVATIDETHKTVHLNTSVYSLEEWHAFVKGVKAGEFDV